MDPKAEVLLCSAADRLRARARNNDLSRRAVSSSTFDGTVISRQSQRRNSVLVIMMMPRTQQATISAELERDSSEGVNGEGQGKRSRKAWRC